MLKHIGTLVLFFLGAVILFSQETDAQKDLLKRAEKNKELLSTNPEKAFEENIKIIEEAQHINAREAELRAISGQCRYYRFINDFENMIVNSKLLLAKAESYQNHVFQTMARIYLFEAYAFTGLHEQALLELKKGEESLQKTTSKDSLTIVTKANLFNSYANYYSLKEDHENRLKYLRLTAFEYKKTPSYFKREFQYIGYANLAAAYMDMSNVDSSRHYVKLSIPEDKEDQLDDMLEFVNWTTLGRIELQEGNYEKAISYFKQAEKIGGYKNHLNVNMLYDKIIEVYQRLNDDKNTKLYESKRDSLKLNVSESQIKSLHNLLNEKEKGINKWYIYVLCFSLISIIVLIIFIIRKNRILAQQEKISQQYLKGIAENPNEKDYSKLLEALKANNPAFMFYFNEIFPEFSTKLLSINPKISSSEIEFCALLKMKIFTKDIARYKYIAPKTVLNKKYLIKNKLKIPENIDIYQWFDGL